MQKYVCINCGAEVKALHKRYSASVLKLVSCESCKNIADKYIEFDPVIIIIDLVLLSREAYRHVLYNTEFKIYWKLAIMLQIMEAYAEYSSLLPPTTSRNHTELDKDVNLNYFHTEDLLFYKLCLKNTFQTACFMLTVVFLTLLYSKIRFKNYPTVSLLQNVCKNIILSSFGVFLLLPSIIWNSNNVQDFHVIFVYLYTTLSQLLAYTIVCECPKLWSIFVITSSYYTKAHCTEVLSYLLLT